MLTEQLTIPATDGVALAATWHAPMGPPAASHVVALAPATGVRRGLYDAFAGFLAGRGIGVLTWDWRGIADSRPPSLRGYAATMRTWGERDLEGAVRWVRARVPGARLAVVGHSFGGQAFGLAPSVRDARALVTIASQDGYWGRWPRAVRWRYALLWHVVMPAVTHAAGYFPARRLGLGEDLPRGVALEWARWCRSPAYLGTWEGHAAIEAPVLGWSFADDPYAPRGAVDALHARFTRAPVTRRHLVPAELGVSRVGHFGFFKGRHEAAWEEIATFVLSAA